MRRVSIRPVVPRGVLVEHILIPEAFADFLSESVVGDYISVLRHVRGRVLIRVNMGNLLVVTEESVKDRLMRDMGMELSAYNEDLGIWSFHLRDSQCDGIMEMLRGWQGE